MRWRILRSLATVVGWGLAGLTFATALLGGVRFFLLTGASPRHLLQRKRWYETSMLGRPMGLRDYLAFGLWVAAMGGHRRP